MDHFNDIQRQRGEPYVKPKSRTSAGALVWFELMDLRRVITCPACGEKEEEIMPTDFCQWYYDCSFCGELLRPKKGHCCVFCSYGSNPCPPIQSGEGCC